MNAFGGLGGSCGRVDEKGWIPVAIELLGVLPGSR